MEGVGGDREMRMELYILIYVVDIENGRVKWFNIIFDVLFKFRLYFYLMGNWRVDYSGIFIWGCI